MISENNEKAEAQQDNECTQRQQVGKENTGKGLC
jgi:hypothetical protein